MQNPLVTVIIPTYNRGASIAKAVASVLEQDYSPIELIVIDDASSDNTLAVLSEIHDSRLAFYSHKENKGANAARNTGFNYSSGEWVAFLDSDDFWDKSKVSLFMDLLLDESNEYLIGYCGINHIDDNKIIKTTSALKSGLLLEQLLYKNIVGSLSVPIMHRKVLEEVSGLDESLKSAQDWDLWVRIAENEHPFGAIPDALVNYLIPNSGKHISNTLSSFLEGRLTFIDKHNRLYKNNSAALSKLYCDMAFLLLNRFGNTKQARKYFLESIKNKLLQGKAYKGMIGTYIPKKLYELLK